MKKKILSIFGTRPEAIKMAPVVKALARAETFDSQVLVTAQHRQMLDQVLSLFEITPDYDLNIMKPNQDLYDITADILSALKAPLKAAKPDLILVHGDTTTCLVAALAAFYQGIPVGHVEAGLRTHDLTAPFPEEANRALVGRLATLHFAPTERAKAHLLAENVAEDRIFVTGNTVIDALFYSHQLLQSAEQGGAGEQEQESAGSQLGSIPKDTLFQIQQQPEKMILITGHRRENFGQGFVDFCAALRGIAEKKPNWLLVYPVHLNPNVQKPVYKALQDCPNIHLISPQEYLPFVWLLSQCDLVITDSGGIQEEAPSLAKPVLVTREVTERPEAVEAGTVMLVGTEAETIQRHAIDILENTERYQAMSAAHNPYGDGQAAGRIVQIVQKYFARVN